MLEGTMGRKAKILAGSALGVVLALTTGAAEAKDKVKISLVQILTTQEWASETALGARAAVADIGANKVELRIQGPAGFEIQKEAQIALSEAESGADAVILSNIAPGGLIEPARIITEKKVPIIWTISAPPNEVKDAFYVGSDAYDLGRAGADLIMSVLEKKYGKPSSELSGDVVQGICVPGLTVLVQRLAGIDSIIAERLPKATLLPTFESKVDLAQNYAAWSQAINKYPRALFYTDPCQDGNKAIQEIRTDHKIDVPQVYYDNPEAAREAVKNGKVTGIASANRFTEGYVAVYVTARALLNDQKLPVGWLKVPHKIITHENIDGYMAAWANSGAGLRKYYDPEIKATVDLPLKNLPPVSDYDHFPK